MDLAFLKGLTERYLSLLPPSPTPIRRPLAFMVTVPSEDVGRDVEKALERMGCTKIDVYRFRVFLRKRWRVSALSTPVDYTVSEIHKWLDRMDVEARKHGATLETWVPTEGPG